MQQDMLVDPNKGHYVRLYVCQSKCLQHRADKGSFGAYVRGVSSVGMRAARNSL